MERFYITEHILDLQMNFPCQDYPQIPQPGLWIISGTGERNHNFRHSMADYNHWYGPQCYGSPAEIHNRDLSVQDGYTCFPAHLETWEHTSHPQRNSNQSQQNSLYNGPSIIGHGHSQYPYHGISESNHYLNHHITVNHSSMMSNYALQSYGLPVANHYCNPSFQSNSYTDFPSRQPRQYLVEQNSVINDGEISWMWKFTCEYCGSSMHSSYTGNYQLHQNHQPPHMQPMEGNDLNLQPQMPSSSSHGHQMDNPQHPYSSPSSRDSSMDSWNRYFGSSSIADDQMINQGNLPSEDNIINHHRFDTQHLAAAVTLQDVIDVRAMYPWDVLLPFEGLLLDLEELIDHRSNGLSEEEIRRHLKIRTRLSSADQFDLNEAPSSKKPRICLNQFDLNEAVPSSDNEPDICVVCQNEYENQERIGTLECGHDYHADCIKKWLQEKNVCPVCKATALSVQS